MTGVSKMSFQIKKKNIKNFKIKRNYFEFYFDDKNLKMLFEGIAHIYLFVVLTKFKYKCF